MPTIKIVSPVSEPGLPVSAHGTRIFWDGDDVTHIAAEWPVSGPVVVKVSRLAFERLDFECDASVAVTILHADPGFELIEEPTASGGHRYFTRKREG